MAARRRISRSMPRGCLSCRREGEVVSWNPSFVRLWKLSDETMSAHTWLTIAAHMESQVESGWDDFKQAAAPGVAPTESCWQMTLEGERTLEVYAQALRDDPKNVGAIQFHFRDVTRNKELETQLRGHQEQSRDLQKRLGELEESKKSYEASFHEHEKRLKHLEKQLRNKDQHREDLEKQLRERNQHREELETTLRDHQDRLHQMHDAHAGQEAVAQGEQGGDAPARQRRGQRSQYQPLRRARQHRCFAGEFAERSRCPELCGGNSPGRQSRRSCRNGSSPLAAIICCR